MVLNDYFFLSVFILCFALLCHNVAGLAEVIMNIFGQGMPLGDAIDSPRLNVRLLGEGDEIQYEGLY